MKKVFTILAVAGAFFTVELTCAMEQGALSSESECNMDSILKWAPKESESNWEWSQEELDNGLDTIHRYAESEVNKVREAYNNRLVHRGWKIVREDFCEELGVRAFEELEKNAGDEETQFTLQFATNPFMAFLVAWTYFKWRKCSDKKYRLFPSRGPFKQTLRNLYSEFKCKDFLGKDSQWDREARAKKRSEAFEVNLQRGEEYRQKLEEANQHKL